MSRCFICKQAAGAIDICGVCVDCREHSRQLRMRLRFNIWKRHKAAWKYWHRRAL